MDSVKGLWAHKNYRMAIVFSVVLLAWMGSGLMGKGDSKSPDAISPAVAPLESVKATYITAQDYQPSLSIRARTEPNRSVQIRAESIGRVVALPVQEGALVHTGDVVCELAEEDRVLRLEEAKVNLRKAQIDFDGSQRMKTQGYQSQSAIVAAEAALAQAHSMVKRQELELANTKIRAPFDGVVNQRWVEIGTYMQRGDVCASVIDLDPLVVAAQVSENSVKGLILGAAATVHLGDTTRTGLVRYISRDADPQTRSFLIEVSVDNPGSDIAGGLTATMTAELKRFPAHALSPALLALDDTGRLGVRIIDSDSRVQWVNVNIVGDNIDGVWVTGLAERVLLITVGQEYVATHQKVTYQLEPAGQGDAQ